MFTAMVVAFALTVAGMMILIDLLETSMIDGPTVESAISEMNHRTAGAALATAIGMLNASHKARLGEGDLSMDSVFTMLRMTNNQITGGLLDQPCRECGGSGAVPFTFELCPVCGGDGAGR